MTAQSYYKPLVFNSNNGIAEASEISADLSGLDTPIDIEKLDGALKLILWLTRPSLLKWMFPLTDDNQLTHKAERVLNKFKQIISNKKIVEHRIAPSVICRSEAELLAISSPRFARRFKVTTDHLKSGSRKLHIVNARRTLKIKDNLELNNKQNAQSNIAEPQNDKQVICHDEYIIDGVKYKLKPFQREKVNIPTIADSLLSLPPRLEDLYIVLQCNLLKYYGEESTPETSNLTPFLQHIDVLGGMCAQAAIFMSLCILEKYTPVIEGISEISYNTWRWTHSANFFPFVKHDGMTDEQMCTYINHYCNSRHQHRKIYAYSYQGIKNFASNPDLVETGYFSRRFHELDKQFLKFALALCIRSGFPVIYLCDQRYMLDRNRSDYLGNTESVAATVLQKNHLSHVRNQGTTSDDVPDGHSVVLVGVSKTDNNKFLVNDPGMLPFIEYDLEDLIHCRHSVFNTTSREPLTYQENADTVQFIPILPLMLPYGGLLNSLDSEDLKTGLIHKMYKFCTQGVDEFIKNYSNAHHNLPDNLPDNLPANYNIKRNSFSDGLAKFIQISSHDCNPSYTKSAISNFHLTDKLEINDSDDLLTFKAEIEFALRKILVSKNSTNGNHWLTTYKWHPIQEPVAQLARILVWIVDPNSRKNEPFKPIMMIDLEHKLLCHEQLY